MTAKSNTPATPAVIMTAAVVAALREATEADLTVSLAARQAASLAHQSDFIGETDKAKRVAAILDLYMPELSRKSVKEQFSAAVAVLVRDEPIRIAASAKTEKADGKLSFTAPEILAKGEASAPDKAVTTVTAKDAVEKLTAPELRAAATVARQELGIGRAPGAGRKPTVKSGESTRAPFFDELAAVLKDSALSMQMFAIVAIAAKQQPSILASCQSILEANGYDVTRKSKKS